MRMVVTQTARRLLQPRAVSPDPPGGSRTNSRRARLLVTARCGRVGDGQTRGGNTGARLEEVHVRTDMYQPYRHIPVSEWVGRTSRVKGFVMRRVLMALLVGLAGVGTGAGVAVAAPAALHVSPGSVPSGGSVHVTGSCEPNTSGVAISSAFLHDATHDFAGVGAASFTTDAAGAFATDALIPAATAPGTYTVTARCGGGNLGVSVTLLVTAAGGVPSGVPAGSGGGAAAMRAGTYDAQLLLGGIGLLLVAGGTFGLARLRRAVRR